MRIDVIGSVLRVVLQHEHYRILPERTLRQRFDDSSEGEIVIRHVCSRRWSASASPGGVVVWEREYLQRRQVPRVHELLELLEPHIHACLILNVEVPS